MSASLARAARRWDSHCRLSGTELESCKAASPYAALHSLRTLRVCCARDASRGVLPLRPFVPLRGTSHPAGVLREGAGGDNVATLPERVRIKAAIAVDQTHIQGQYVA
jgi:hypothetical protein